MSVFEPHTESIRKGKARKPTEFGKLVQVQEAENPIITPSEGFAQRPSDSELFVGAVAEPQRKLGRTPTLGAADAGFYTRENERAIPTRGVKWVSIPNRNSRSPDRRSHQRQRWFRKGQRWRTGGEGRISLLKRRHGLSRCRYRGFEGMQRWVGLGVIADNVIHGAVLWLDNARHRTTPLRQAQNACTTCSLPSVGERRILKNGYFAPESS